MTNRPGPIVRRLLRAPGLLYDWHAGWLLGHRFLRLTHLGRRSGRRYRTMLEVVGTGQAPGEVVVVAGLVSRQTDSQDARTVRVGLTPLGQERLEGLAASHLEELDRLTSDLHTLWAGLDADR